MTKLEREIVKVHEEIEKTQVGTRKMEALKARRRVLERYQEIWEEFRAEREQQEAAA